MKLPESECLDSFLNDESMIFRYTPFEIYDEDRDIYWNCDTPEYIEEHSWCVHYDGED
jgi:hypothetical protein